MSVAFNPIGTVKTEDGRYYIELEPQYTDAVLGLEEFSHIMVLWWCNLYDSPEARGYLVLDKPYKKGPDKIGVLATRSPVRPNPIGLSACVLAGVDRVRRRLELGYIDAENGTPVLDIKPYETADDTVRDVVMPPWCAHWPKCLEESGAFDWSGEFNF